MQHLHGSTVSLRLPSERVAIYRSFQRRIPFDIDGTFRHYPELDDK
jgi:hypothetical protein